MSSNLLIASSLTSLIVDKTLEEIHLKILLP